MSLLRSAVHRAALHSRLGIEGLAGAMSTAEVRVNPAILRNQLTGNERHHLGIERAELIMDLLDSDELAHAAAQQRGGVFVRLPAGDSDGGDLAVLEMITHVWRAGGEVGKAVDDALADHVVERSEIAKIRKAIYRQQQALMAMLARLESMAE